MYTELEVSAKVILTQRLLDLIFFKNQRKSSIANQVNELTEFSIDASSLKTMGENFEINEK